MTAAARSCTAIAVLSLLATGCGGGGESTSSKPPTKEAAASAAKAINLVKADLPASWTSEPADSSDSADDDVVAQLASCLGVSASEVNDESTDLANVDSDDFSQGAPPAGVMASSSVEVVPSEEVAKHEVDLFQSDKAAPCLQKVFDKQLRKELASDPGVSLGTVAVKQTQPSADGTDGAFGFTMTVSISAQGTSIPVGIELLGFLKKHTEVSLMTTSFGAPFPSAQRDSLYAKLVNRAETSAV